MSLRALIVCIVVLLALALPGCGGGNDSANEFADRPKSPKKADGK